MMGKRLRCSARSFGNRLASLGVPPPPPRASTRRLMRGPTPRSNLGTTRGDDQGYGRRVDFDDEREGVHGGEEEAYSRQPNPEVS